jgi:hypothetical protein
MRIKNGSGSVSESKAAREALKHKARMRRMAEWSTVCGLLATTHTRMNSAKAREQTIRKSLIFTIF